MGKATNNNHESASARWNGLSKGILQGAPHLHGLLVRDGTDFIRLTIKQRGEDDYIAVLSRVNGDGVPEVLFGTSYDLIGSILSLNAAAASNSWREDKPYKKG